MKLDTLLTEIRLIIREEIKKALIEQEVINERKGMTSISKPKLSAETSEQLLNQLKPKPVATKPTTKEFSKNPLINKLLNETYVSGMDEIDYNDFSEWPSMQTNVMPSLNSTVNVESMLPKTDIEGRRLNVDAVPEDVANALTRDYRSLMKAIDKKKGL